MGKIRLGLIWLILGVFILSPVGMCLAQVDLEGEDSIVEEEVQEKIQIVPEAGVDKKVAVSRNVIFDASKTIYDKESQPDFLWDFGDGTSAEGIETIHAYNQPGTYRVTLTVVDGAERYKDTLSVAVFNDLIILIADSTPSDEEINSITRYAEKQNVLLFLIREKSEEAGYLLEGELLNALLEEKDTIKKSDIIITWTAGDTGLNVLSRFAQTAENLENLGISSKGIVTISDANFNSLSRIAQSTFSLLNPEYILLTKETALHEVIDAKASEEVVGRVTQENIDNRLIGIHSERAVGKLGVTNFLSYTVYYLVNRGVSIQNIILVLMVPLIATIISFARQVLGVKILGIYTTTILILSFVAIGIRYGLLVFLIILSIASLFRFLLRRFRLLYIPRMALVLSVVALTILGLFILGAVTDRLGLISLSIFPILVLVMLTEKFISLQIERGAWPAIRITFETLVVSVICYYIVNWEALKTFLLGYPELILLTLVINVLLGKWIGLRITEYFRFREVRKYKQESVQ